MTWTAAEDRAVAALVTQVCADRLGQVSPSVYETARLVASAPWLAGHAERLRFLLATQRPDGSWGAPDGYALVPTLSATEALLTSGRSGETALADAASRGVAALTDLLRARPSIPDTIAAELIVPWLVGEINAHLGEPRLGLPAGIDGSVLAKLRQYVRSGQPIPEKAWHSLEAFGLDARQAPLVKPSHGLVCGSPAATAAWLGERSDHESSGFLELLQAKENGPVRGVAPIDFFEAAWITSILADAGLPLPHALATRLESAFLVNGAPAGRGLPADADDTAAVLYALAKLGRPGPIELLWDYEGDDCFRCFPAELTPSISTNAHVLDALGEYAPPGHPRFRDAIDKVTRYLHASQEADGSWWDKWHASPYYATTCCALALNRAAGPAVRPMVTRAIGWLLDTQRADGSWGRWTGTAEETAYAVQMLLLCGDPDDAAVSEAALRAGDFLRTADEYPPLWHDKDLYTPIAVVRAARLAALRLIATHAHAPTVALG